MIKKLERKIQWTIFLILMVTAIGVFFTINITNYQSLVMQERTYLQKLGTNMKKAPVEPLLQMPSADASASGPAISEAKPVENSNMFHGYYHSYIVQISSEGTVSVSIDENSVICTEDEIAALAEEILSSGAREGMQGKLRFLVKTLPDKKEVVFLESQALSRSLVSFLRSSFLCLGLMILFFLAARTLSRRIVRPVEEAFTRQKQFISDASHELKTPVTVINANIDLLRTEIGENKWMDYIESEGQRMTALITSLLTLSRVSSDTAPEEAAAHFCEFDLSSALLGTALSFESLAFEHGISYEVDIEENLRCTGSETEICQLAAILLDNAMKYASQNGCVQISLKSCGQTEGHSLSFSHHPRHTALLTVSNSGPEIPREEQEKIFDRFYRTDKSRNRASGGFGLGLAIARSIAEKHGGEISVSCHDGLTAFTVKL